MSRIRFRSLMVALALVSTGALAQTLARTETQTTAGAAEGPLAKFRGSAFGYSHTATAFTFAPGAQPFYNPTWLHRISLMPEFHPTDSLYVRGRVFLSQELTLADDTTYRNEVQASDISFDVGSPGWTEPTTKIRIGGDVRFSIPTSKLSWAQSRITTLGPTMRVSRSFPVMSGLFVSYTTRFTWRINRFATFQNNSPSVAACGDPSDLACAEFLTTGLRAAWGDVAHGPTVVFSPHPRVSVNAVFQMLHLFLPALAPDRGEFAGAQGLQGPTGTNVRDLTAFDLSASWTALDQLTLSLGVSTFSRQIGADGTRLFPLVNRDTTIYLDATVDLESTISKFL